VLIHLSSFVVTLRFVSASLLSMSFCNVAADVHSILNSIHPVNCLDNLRLLKNTNAHIAIQTIAILTQSTDLLIIGNLILIKAKRLKG
jgi:hypothetical protein